MRLPRGTSSSRRGRSCSEPLQLWHQIVKGKQHPKQASKAHKKVEAASKSCHCTYFCSLTLHRSVTWFCPSRSETAAESCCGSFQQLTLFFVDVVEGFAQPVGQISRQRGSQEEAARNLCTKNLTEWRYSHRQG